MSFIEFKNICKKYAGNDKNSVTDFNLDIEEKEFIAFVGPSGCGKSTTLRMIAGFEEITSGDLFIDGKRVNEVAPADRGISMVFQNYALYPHMTVEKNISYGLKNMKVPADEIKKKVDWAIDILGLEEYRYRKPKNLSGGQRQRVALGRAIVKDQKVFLMDEPLSNLDAKLRVSMRNEISKLHRNLGSTTIYVTHDQVEAMTMADRIVIMKDGVIQQVGKPMDLYEHPVNKFVAGFIGSPQMNFYDVKVDGKKLIFADGNTVELPEAIAKRIAGYSEVIMGIRGEDIKFDITNLDVYGSHQKAVIDNTEIMGNENNLYFDFGGSVTIARVSKYEVSQVGRQGLPRFCRQGRREGKGREAHRRPERMRREHRRRPTVLRLRQGKRALRRGAGRSHAQESPGSQGRRRRHLLLPGLHQRQIRPRPSGFAAEVI